MYENSCNIQKSFTVKNSFSSFPVVVTLVFPLEKLMSAFLMFPEGVQENLHLDFHCKTSNFTFIVVSNHVAFEYLQGSEILKALICTR